MENKKNKIPTISFDRLDSENLKLNSSNIYQETSEVKSFIKGKEPIQAITLRFPRSMYKQIRELAFYKEEKINKMVVAIVAEYLKTAETTTILNKKS